ncbi:MAG: hypothetical protein VXW22_11760, partial [Pseudomonadota bacterium]|nr:hypothetical protein [Pseudomonadota bacterium]
MTDTNNELTLTLSFDQYHILRKAMIAGAQRYNDVMGEYDSALEMDFPPPRNCTSAERQRWDVELRVLKNLQEEILTAG